MGGGVLSSRAPSLHEHSRAVLSGTSPHWSAALQRGDPTRVCLNVQRFTVARRETENDEGCCYCSGLSDRGEIFEHSSASTSSSSSSDHFSNFSPSPGTFRAGVVFYSFH